MSKKEHEWEQDATLRIDFLNDLVFEPPIRASDTDPRIELCLGPRFAQLVHKSASSINQTSNQRIVAAAALSAVSACTTAYHHVHVSNGHTLAVVPNLYVAIVGASGTGKSAVHGIFSPLLHNVDQLLIQEFEPDDPKRKGGEKLLKLFEESLIAANTTSQGLIAQMAKRPDLSVTIWDEEGRAMFAKKDGKDGPDLTWVLRGKDCAPISSGTKGDGSQYIDPPHLSITLFIQPGILASFLSGERSGIMPRFQLFLMPISKTDSLADATTNSNDDYDWLTESIVKPSKKNTIQLMVDKLATLKNAAATGTKRARIGPDSQDLPSEAEEDIQDQAPGTQAPAGKAPVSATGISAKWTVVLYDTARLTRHRHEGEFVLVPKKYLLADDPNAYTDFGQPEVLDPDFLDLISDLWPASYALPLNGIDAKKCRYFNDALQKLIGTYALRVYYRWWDFVSDLIALLRLHGLTIACPVLIKLRTQALEVAGTLHVAKHSLANPHSRGTLAPNTRGPLPPKYISADTVIQACIWCHMQLIERLIYLPELQPALMVLYPALGIRLAAYLAAPTSLAHAKVPTRYPYQDTTGLLDADDQAGPGPSSVAAAAAAAAVAGAASLKPEKIVAAIAYRCLVDYESVIKAFYPKSRLDLNSSHYTGCNVTNNVKGSASFRSSFKAGDYAALFKVLGGSYSRADIVSLMATSDPSKGIKLADVPYPLPANYLPGALGVFKVGDTKGGPKWTFTKTVPRSLDELGVLKQALAAWHPDWSTDKFLPDAALSALGAPPAPPEADGARLGTKPVQSPQAAGGQPARQRPNSAGTTVLDNDGAEP